MEAVAPTRAGALRGCSGRRRTDRSQDWGLRWGEGGQLKRTLTEGGGNLGLGPILVGPGGGAQHKGGGGRVKPHDLATPSVLAINT